MEQSTSKLTLTLSKELIESIKTEVRRLYGKRKGGISFYVEMVMRNDLRLGHKDVEEP